MCGRFTNFAEPQAMQSMLNAIGDVRQWPPAWPTRYNIAPTQLALTAHKADNAPHALSVTSMAFGIHPAFMSHGVINARAETVADKPMFRRALNQQRCLVLANGFYEWGRNEAGEKAPFHFSRRDGKPFAFAGLYRPLEDATRTPPMKDATHGFVIITTQANDVVGAIHGRMPVILDEQTAKMWLDADVPQPALVTLLTPFDAKAMSSCPADRRINSPKFEGTAPF
jgi:putative SOS response-associated peptidase YedK